MYGGEAVGSKLNEPTYEERMIGDGWTKEQLLEAVVWSNRSYREQCHKLY